jgi:hypothetical protein
MGIAAVDLGRIPADHAPVFAFHMDRRVDFFGVMPITIAGQAQPDQPAPQLALRADA